jgi:hypothetical protein
MRSEFFKLTAQTICARQKIWTAHVTAQIPAGLVASSKSQSVISNFKNFLGCWINRVSAQKDSLFANFAPFVSTNFAFFAIIYLNL